jgi:UDP-N-acetylmuramate dehydrogenase
MVLDPGDPNTRSVGSFFTNPVLTPAAFTAVEAQWRSGGGQHSQASQIPTFPADGGVKVPAAWLVERAGFAKGYRQGGVGISSRHALALVNFGGTSAELLALAERVRAGVEARFGVRLEFEPEVVG